MVSASRLLRLTRRVLFSLVLVVLFVRSGGRLRCPVAIRCRGLLRLYATS